MYTFIPHRLIYFKCLFLLILMIIITDNLWKPQIQYLRKFEYCEKVQYWRHLVPHSNQLINSKHLQKPWNGLSV